MSDISGMSYIPRLYVVCARLLLAVHTNIDTDQIYNNFSQVS